MRFVRTFLDNVDFPISRAEFRSHQGYRPLVGMLVALERAQHEEGRFIGLWEPPVRFT